jgi:hypothetical protein
VVADRVIISEEFEGILINWGTEILLEVSYS